MALRPKSNKSSVEIVEELLKTHDKLVAEAFLSSIEELVSVAEFNDIVNALEVGDIEEALRRFNIEPAAFDGVADAVTLAYVDGGRTTIASIPTINNAIIRFNARNPAAENWLRARSSNLVSNLSVKQSATLREILSDGLSAGRNPRSLALDVVGRVDSVTGRRQGGMLGLTNEFAKYVNNARLQLSSGLPSELKKYLNREQRDKRFDSLVRKSIKDNKSLTKSAIDRITGSYSNKLLMLRATNIARTETLQALNSAQYEAYSQAVASGSVSPSALKIRWKASFKNTRDSHLSLHNKEITFGQHFTSIYGSKMKHPHDNSMSAKAKDVVNCACIAEYRIDFTRNLL